MSSVLGIYLRSKTLVTCFSQVKAATLGFIENVSAHGNVQIFTWNSHELYGVIIADYSVL